MVYLGQKVIKSFNDFNKACYYKVVQLARSYVPDYAFPHGSSGKALLERYIR